jgi:hypothetical protein
VPWQDNEAWDAAIDRSTEIAIGGGRTDDGRPTTEYLYRPGQLVCDTGVWRNPRGPDQERVRGRLEAARAHETVGAPRFDRDDLRARVAGSLGLTLLNVLGAELSPIVNEARRLAPGALAFNHVMVAAPQRHGGCSPPTPLTQASVQIPGRVVAVAQPQRTVAVLDTGVAAGIGWVDPDSDIEPAAPGSPAAGHGTMVAGVIARYAPTARILVKQVLDMPLGVADELEIADALATLPNVDVVNASFGGLPATAGKMVTFERAVHRLPRETLVVASAGNEGLDRSFYMAAFRRVVGVASGGDVDGALDLYDYSNRGEWVDATTQGTDVETLAAPSQPVLASGTSFAAPKIVAKVLEFAQAQGINDLRAAASLLLHDPARPEIPGRGGTFIDMPTP